MDGYWERKHVGNKLKFLALAIYGTVIFLTTNKVIDDKVIIFCNWMFRDAMTPTLTSCNILVPKLLLLGQKVRGKLGFDN